MAPPRSSGFTDPGWEHGVSQDEKKKKVKCNYCGKIVSGGIYRLKQHLARISGEVTFCRKAPDEVCEKMKDNLAGSQAIKKHRRCDDDDQASFELHSNDDIEEADETRNFEDERQGDLSAKSLVLCSAPLRSLGYVDPGWEHGVAQDARKKKVKCNYCEKIVSGGINRFKQHLARIPGEVASCKMAPDQVYLKMKENMKWHRTGRRQQPESELTAFLEDSEHDEVGDVEHTNGERSKISQLFHDQILIPRKGSRRRCSSESDPQAKKYVKVLRSEIHPPKQLMEPENKKNANQEVAAAISKFFYHSGVPLDAVDSPYFHQMLDVVSQFGPGWKSPSARSLSGQLLQEEMASIKESQMEMKASWMVSGCTIMVDRWNDVEDRRVVKFLVSSPKGTSFISSVDASDFTEDPTSVFKMLDKTVEEVGEENVVQVVTESSPTFIAAGRMLEEKRKNLFWTPCAAHSIDLVLEDFLALKFIDECVSKAQKITRLIYNYSSLLNLAKDFAGEDLLRPARTKSLSTFLSLHCLLDRRNALRRMFQSTKWVSSRFADAEEGRQVQKIALSSTFWKKIQYIVESADPILQLLLKIEDDSEPILPSIYHDLIRAKLSIKEIHGGDESKYAPFLMIIDNHLNPLFHHPIYAAAYFLNPSLRYNPDFLLPPEAIGGVDECIARMEPDSERKISASIEIADFVSGKDDFGTELAVSTRAELDPAAWWREHGVNGGALQRIAVRILSQRCCSVSGLSGGSTGTCPARFGLNRNRLVRKLRSDWLFVHCNVRLRDRQLSYPGLHQVFLDRLLGGWLCEFDDPPTEKEDMAVRMYEEVKAFPEIVEPLEFQHGVDCGGPRDDDAAPDIDFFGDG